MAQTPISLDLNAQHNVEIGLGDVAPTYSARVNITTPSSAAGTDALKIKNSLGREIWRQSNDGVIYANLQGNANRMIITGTYFRHNGYHECGANTFGYTFNGDTSLSLTRSVSGVISLLQSNTTAPAEVTNVFQQRARLSVTSEAGGRVAIGYNSSRYHSAGVTPDAEVMINCRTNDATDSALHIQNSSTDYATSDTVLRVRNDGVIITKEFAKASLPPTVAGGFITVTDESGGRTLATSNGTEWLRVSDGLPVK